MSPEERRMLTELFDRVKGVAGTPRDREAEDLIAQMLREQPYSGYYLAQAVIVQEQALKATTERLQALQDQVQRLEADAGASRSQNTGFLGSLGSLFGGSQQPQTLPSRDAYAQREGRLYDDYARTGRYRDPDPEPMPAPSPWGRAGATGPWAQPSRGVLGGGFLGGALTTAAGVAGGVLVADAVKDLFSPHMGGTNPAAGLGAFGDNPVQETVVNNFFGDNDRSNDRDDRGGDRDSGGGGGDYDRDDNNNDDDNDFDAGDFGDDDDTFA